MWGNFVWGANQLQPTHTPDHTLQAIWKNQTAYNACLSQLWWEAGEEETHKNPLGEYAKTPCIRTGGTIRTLNPRGGR